MSAFQNDVQNSGKMNTFLGIFAGVNECLLRWDLVILWLKVEKNYGIPEICVFLGLFFCVSLASGSNETWHSRNLCFWVGFLVFLWPQVAKKHGIPKICVFLHA